VISVSSRAALGGSPLSGGYAGAKAAVRLVAGYAADESARAGLGIRFLSLLPGLTSATGLGAAAVRGYARRLGVEAEAFEQLDRTRYIALDIN
jgi:NAD(P)-dependent dehydrogenase (short-subunit alcohol dehydrogenase family)